MTTDIDFCSVAAFFVLLLNKHLLCVSENVPILTHCSSNVKGI